MSTNLIAFKRLLVSVTDKTDLKMLAALAQEFQIELIASGGSASELQKLGAKVTSVQEITGNPEAFGGRMKTLSFQISSSLLYRRGHEQDESEALELGIKPIDGVSCNFYPFFRVAREQADDADLIENIDIGGPSMVRAAAKNFASVVVLTSPYDYQNLARELRQHQGATSREFRQALALKAFRYTAEYEAVIAEVLSTRWKADEPFMLATPGHAQTLRYGENPHQKAWSFAHPLVEGIAGVVPLQGKELSYNNLLDADAAFRSCFDLHQLARGKMHAVTIIKHLNPCGAALAADAMTALKAAWSGDPVSSFGGILAFNYEVDEEVAQYLSENFIEVVIAPGFSAGALEIMKAKKNVRLLVRDFKRPPDAMMIRSIDGGVLVQEEDRSFASLARDTTSTRLPDHWQAFASHAIAVTKHLRSNAIALFEKSGETFRLVGAGMGNPNRLVSIEQAVAKARENGIEDFSDILLVSDAFFPFSDSITLLAQHGIRHIIQPGGSMRDPEVVAAAESKGMSLLFTGERHFRH